MASCDWRTRPGAGNGGGGRKRGIVMGRVELIIALTALLGTFGGAVTACPAFAWEIKLQAFRSESLVFPRVPPTQTAALARGASTRDALWPAKATSQAPRSVDEARAWRSRWH
jgi:hypothetical protein